ncbi:MAG: hypothetical protein VB934_18245, partial [Polyangiaceae bacterium]
CKAKSDADCKRTQRCAEWGWCSAEKGNCRARNDADCKTSMFCKKRGRCVHHDEKCVKQKIAPTEGPLEKRSGPVR